MGSLETSSPLPASYSSKAPFILAAVSLSTFLATFNETFLNVALSPIMVDYSISADVVQWISTAYMLIAAIMVPLTGFFYRRFNTKPLLASALILLFVGSIICFLTPSFAVLVLGRVIQGMGTGMLVPIGMNVTLAIAPRDRIGTYMGIITATVTLGPAFGPIFAGLILSVASWHYLFAVFALIVLATMIFALSVVGNISRTHPLSLDIVSTILASAGLVIAMYGVSSLSSALIFGLILIVAGVVIIGYFLYRQARLDEPFLNIEPFKSGAFNVGLATVFCSLMIVFSMNMVLPLFMQSALGYSPLQAALVLLPACLVSCILAPIAGRIFDKCGLRFMTPIGTALITLCITTMLVFSQHLNSVSLIALYVPTIAGCALVMGPAQSFALSHLEPRLHPHGTTIVSVGFQLAGCLGSVLFMGVYAVGQQRALIRGLSASEASTTGFATSCTAAAIIAVVALCCALTLGRIEIRALRSRLTADAGAVAQRAPYEWTARDVMDSPAFSVTDDASAYEALAQMVAHKTSGLPVVDAQRRVIGFVTDGQLLRAISNDPHDQINMSYIFALWARPETLNQRVNELKQINIMDLCFKRVTKVDVDASVEHICDVLSDRQIKKVPVTDDGTLAGVISRTALLRLMMQTSDSVTQGSVPVASDQ